MLKKKFFIILIFIVSFSFFENVSYANNQGVVYLTSEQNEVNQQEEIEITVNLKNSKIAACNFNIYFENEKVEFISVLNQENAMNNLVENRVSFVWFDVFGGERAKEGEIATFKFKSKENGSTTFTIDGEFYNEYGQLIETSFEEKQIRIGKEESKLQEQSEEEQGTNEENSNCNLQVLRLDREGIVPNFEKDIKEYYLAVPNNIKDIDVLAISENPEAVVDIKGNTNLQNGINDITIEVTSADKTQSAVYTVHVSKTDDLDRANTNLEILAIENVLLNPPFDTLQTEYEAYVSNETENLNIFAVPENEQASVEIIGRENLKEGENLIKVIVKAQDGLTKKIYKIKVNRRTITEENKYNEEQEKQKEELENAYKIQKTSSIINGQEGKFENKQDEANKTITIWIVCISSLILVVFIVIWKIRKRQK